MASFDFDAINLALSDANIVSQGVDFTEKKLKLDSENDAKQIVDAISECKNLGFLTLTGNTLGVAAAEAIAKALEKHPEFKQARWSDMFTGRMKTEIPPALSALGNGMIVAGARLSILELSDNAFGPIGVEGLAKLLESAVCSQLQELRLNNNGLGITGGRLLAKALLKTGDGHAPPRLKVFIAGRNRLENEGAKALAEVFQKMGSLEEIAMPQNGIYHVGITALAEAFKVNPNLRTLNLNDNTIGPKGALAFVDALPRLKGLRDLNFGDCLLKSKGAAALAKGFKDNAVMLEYLDLSHNEIGKSACQELVDALTSLPDSLERLNRVVLAGNSLGGANAKKGMREKLGAAAELSDGEGTDDDYESDSQASDGTESEGESDSDRSEDSATEEAQHREDNNRSEEALQDTSAVQDLDNSGVEEVQSDVALFLKHPTLSNLRALGPQAADVIDTHLQAIIEPVAVVEAYVEAVLKVSGLALQDAAPLMIARRLYAALLARAAPHAVQWATANAMLVGLGLIKSENKDHKLGWELPGCFAVLATVIEESHFPPSLRETLRFFINANKHRLHDTVDHYPTLC